MIEGSDLVALETLSSSYGPETISELLDRLANGDTLLDICRDPLMPERRTVQKWTHRSSEFARLYRLARLEGVLFMLEEAMEIADDDSDDLIEDAKGVERVDHGRVQRARLKVDTRIRVADRLSRALRDVLPVGSVMSPFEALMRKMMAMPEQALEKVSRLSGFELQREAIRLLNDGSNQVGPEDGEDPRGSDPGEAEPA